MSKYYFVAVKNVLGVCSNDKKFKWSYGMNMPETTQEDYESCVIRMRLDVVKHIEPSLKGEKKWDNLPGKYHYFSGIHGQDILRYRRKFFFGSELQIEARDLLSDEPHLTVNRHYYKYITHKFMNLHSIGYILTDIAGLTMLRKGFAPVHCSAFQSGDNNVLILAAPNTGKTLSTMMCCMEHCAGFIAEDLALTDGKMIYSVPWTSTFRYYSKVDESRFNKMINRITQVFPPLELISFTRPKPIDDYVENQRLVDSAEVTHIAILERGEEGVTNESADEIYRKAINLNRYEFNYHKAPLVVAYEFFNPDLNIDEACATERRIFHELIENAQELLVVKTNDATHYAGLLLDHLEK